MHYAAMSENAADGVYNATLTASTEMAQQNCQKFRENAVLLNKVGAAQFSIECR